MLEVGYAIGVSKPVNVSINMFGTSSYSDEFVLELIDSLFDFRPDHIIDTLDLRHTVYHELTNFGHFGRSSSLFEKTDKVAAIKDYMNKRA